MITIKDIYIENTKKILWLSGNTFSVLLENKTLRIHWRFKFEENKSIADDVIFVIKNFRICIHYY